MDNSKEQHNIQCYNCKSSNCKIIHKGTRDNSNIDVLCCKECGLVFLSDNTHISENFYEEGGMLAGKINLENWIRNTEPDDKRRFSMLENSIKDKVITDFGCGNAGFLNLAKNFAKKVYGVELQKDFVSYFKDCGLDIFQNIYEIPEKSDVITMFHVLEHIKDPVSALKELKKVLKDENSRIFIEVPNAKDALVKLYNCQSFQDFVYWSCHLYVYDKKTLSQIIEKAGYKIEKFSYIQRYSLMNHMHWILKHKPGGHKKWSKFDFKIINKLYSFILKLSGTADTIFVEISLK